MHIKKEVDIILLVLFIVLFFGLGSYIGVKDGNGEKVLDVETNYVWEPAENAMDIFPKIKPKEATIEMPVAIIIEDEDGIKIIEIKDTKYFPNELNISVGTTVYWVNQDPKRIYKVYERSQEQTFNSFQIVPFENFSHTFDKPGVYYFTDATFSFMKGVIRVE